MGGTHVSSLGLPVGFGPPDGCGPGPPDGCGPGPPDGFGPGPPEGFGPGPPDGIGPPDPLQSARMTMLFQAAYVAINRAHKRTSRDPRQCRKLACHRCIVSIVVCSIRRRAGSHSSKGCCHSAAHENKSCHKCVSAGSMLVFAELRTGYHSGKLLPAVQLLPMISLHMDEET